MNELKQRPAVTHGFMSKVTIPITLQNATYFRSPYEQHRSLWRMFGEESDANFLFREVGSMGHQHKTRTFLVVSARRPIHVEGFNITSRQYAPRLRIGDSLEFSIRISVTSSKAAAPAGDQNRMRGLKVDPIIAALHGHTSAEDRQRIRRMWLFPYSLEGSHEEVAPLLVSNWLVPRFTRHGVKVNTDKTVVNSYEPAGLMGFKNKGEHQIRFSVAEVSGEIMVVDPEALANALFQGIGRGKGLGCGMLLVRRSRAGQAFAIGRVNQEESEEELP